MLRVISGKYGKRLLKQPPLEITRPTMDRVKEAFFSMIQFDVPGSVVLDLFAGSGSLSIESVSRGAAKAIAVEKSREAIKIIQDNIASLGISNISLIQADVLEYLPRLHGSKFDFIFMDPPYKETGLCNASLEAIIQNGLLKTGGLIILETSSLSDIHIPDGLAIQKQSKYGTSNVILIANNI